MESRKRALLQSCNDKINTLHTLPTHLLPISLVSDFIVNMDNPSIPVSPTSRRQSSVPLSLQLWPGHADIDEHATLPYMPHANNFVSSNSDDPLERLVAKVVSRRKQFNDAVESLKKNINGSRGTFYERVEREKTSLENLQELYEYIESTLFHVEEVTEPPISRFHPFIKAVTSGIQHVWHTIKTDRAFRYGSQVAISIMLASMLTFISYFRERIDSKGWACITVIMVFEPSFGGFLKKSMQRIYGTIFGAIFGVVALSLGYFIPLIAEYSGIYLCALLSIFGFTVMYFKISNPNRNYALNISVLTAAIVILSEYSASERGDDKKHPPYQAALKRAYLVIIGVVIAFTVSTFIFSERASRRVPEAIGNTLTTIANLQEFIEDSYAHSSGNNFNSSLFRDEAYEYVDTISRQIATLRDINDTASGEIFLNASERLAVKQGKECYKHIQRMFYLTVTIVYARMWSPSTELHVIMAQRIQIIRKVTDITLRTISFILRGHLIENMRGDEMAVRDPQVLLLLKDAVLMGIGFFQEQQKRLLDEEDMGQFGDADWTTWNHYALSFLQFLINLVSVMTMSL
eukprot:Partr_v1_DN28600_c2_g4_i3_m72622